MIVTAKHHDGFSMFKSMVDDYNIVDYTPFKRDVIKEFADACKEEGIKFGVYYSQDLDWYEKDGGGYKTLVENCAGSSWDNNWDFGSKDKCFNKYFKKKAFPQIKELMTNYGEISLVWFDMPLTLSKHQSKQIYNLCKKYQPNCLINSRLGYGKYDYVSLGDNEIPSEIEMVKKGANLNSIDGFKYSKNKLYETACTLNKSWGYSRRDKKYKKVEELRAVREKLSRLGVNFLLNVGLDENGCVPKECEEIIKGMCEYES